MFLSCVPMDTYLVILFCFVLFKQVQYAWCGSICTIIRYSNRFHYRQRSYYYKHPAALYNHTLQSVCEVSRVLLNSSKWQWVTSEVIAIQNRTGSMFFPHSSPSCLRVNRGAAQVCVRDCVCVNVLVCMFSCVIVWHANVTDLRTF